MIRAVLILLLLVTIGNGCSDADNGPVVSSDGLACGPLIKRLDEPLMDQDALAIRYESLDGKQAKCVDEHIAICPDFLMQQCEEEGSSIGGGCEHLLAYDRNFDVQYFIEQCSHDD